MPRVAVILPACNAAGFLAPAVESILAQTSSDFELLAYDDGSVDATLEILQSLARQDRRLRVIAQKKNGLIATLNSALDLLTAERRVDFIARMDADDISLPTRLEKQIAYLDARRHIVACGTWIETFSDTAAIPAETNTSQTLAARLPADPAVFAATLLFRNPLAHPTVMFRRDIFGAPHAPRYNPAAIYCEDWSLWSTLAATHQLANIPEVLFRYRLHPAQVSAAHAEKQRSNLQHVFRQLLARLAIVPTPDQLATHTQLAFNSFPPGQDFITAADAWLRLLLAANTAVQAFPAEPFARVLTGRYVALVKHARAQNPSVDLSPAASPFAPFILPSAV